MEIAILKQLLFVQLSLNVTQIINSIDRNANKKGKVHGSLARAGKVKGQTPKVEKVDKKKKVTGF
jgi:hypothetical protein